MSPEDIRDEKARLLLDYQETEDEVNGLQAKLARVADAYQSFADLLRKHPDAMLRAGQSYTGAVVAAPVSEDIIATVTDVAEIMALSSSLRAAKSKLRELSERKRALNIR